MTLEYGKKTRRQPREVGHRRDEPRPLVRGIVGEESCRRSLTAESGFVRIAYRLGTQFNASSGKLCPAIRSRLKKMIMPPALPDRDRAATRDARSRTPLPRRAPARPARGPWSPTG